MTKRNAGKRLVRLDAANHQFLNSLIEKNAITSFNDALTKIISYVKSKPDFTQDTQINMNKKRKVADCSDQTTQEKVMISDEVYNTGRLYKD